LQFGKLFLCDTFTSLTVGQSSCQFADLVF
jgi:hypothetical protein